jgi:uncharacterized membrane protein YbhN (UPF0104 family)
MTARGRQFAKLFVRFLITTALLVWVFNQIDLGRFGQAVRIARWEFLVAVWGLTVVLFWIRSFKMRIILKRQGCDVDCVTLFGATTVTCLYSMIVPGMLSTGVKWYILRRSTGKGSNVLSSMLYNQFSTVALMTVFGLAALMISNPASLPTADAKNRWQLPVICGVLLIGVLLLSLLLMSQRAGGRILEVIRNLSARLPLKIREKRDVILEQIAVFQALSWPFHLAVASITLIDTLLGGAAMYALAARSANITVSLPVMMWLCAVIYILGRLPISVANLGVRESMLISLLAMYGVDKPSALLMSMILFSALVFMGAIGAMFQLRWASAAKKPAYVEQEDRSNEVFGYDLKR